MKLSRNNQGDFSWSCIKYQSKIISSKYAYQTGWGYAEKLWIFGGEGVQVDDYLNKNGGFSLVTSYYNNQLLCFDPSCEKWTNPQCGGNIPEPRVGHSTAILGDTVWLTGGFSSSPMIYHNDLYQLDMHSLGWTKMQIIEPKPSVRRPVSLSAISDRHLLLLLQGNFIDDTDDMVSEILVYVNVTLPSARYVVRLCRPWERQSEKSSVRRHIRYYPSSHSLRCT